MPDFPEFNRKTVPGSEDVGRILAIRYDTKKLSNNVPTKSVLGGAATCSEGFVTCFLKVPLACLGCMAAAVQPSGLGNSRKFVYKTFRTSGRPTQYLNWLLLLQTRLLLFLFAWERIQKSQRPQLLAMVQRLQKYCPNNVLETLRTG